MMIHRFVPASSTVYTPADLAAAMVRAARGYPENIWLDPCVGEGAFVAHFSNLGVPSTNVLAVDIDPNPSQRDQLARTTRGVDFVKWAYAREDSVDHVVMNPPYVALGRLGGEPRKQALAVKLADGGLLALKANYWCAFVVQAMRCIRNNGSLVAVLPAAWDFAKYARRVRDTVYENFGEVLVVRSAAPLFPHVHEGSVVLVCFNRGSKPCTIRRIEVANLNETVQALNHIADRSALRGATVVRNLLTPQATNVRLDSIIDIGIGAVTGDSKFFLLSEPERISRGLPKSALRPILSRSKHLQWATVGPNEWQTLRDSDARVWLFRPEQSALKHAAVKAYLKHGQSGGCNIEAYKIKSRTPWHQTPLPRNIDGFISGMSKHLPFLVLRGMKGLTATNTLYVVKFKRVVSSREKAALGLLLLTTSIRKDLTRRARAYADGLMKFEPSDLAALRVPVVSSYKDATFVYRKAIKKLLSGQEQEATKLADNWLARCANVSYTASAGTRAPSAAARLKEISVTEGGHSPNSSAQHTIEYETLQLISST